MQNISQLMDIDRHHIWHPYSSIGSDAPIYLVESAQGVVINLATGQQLIDGMSSWWSAIHGYNHPVINQAINQQLKKMSHIMFGGLTHQPAIELTQLLIELTPPSLQAVFFSDSGSVSVDVALKMAIQYWHSKKQPSKQKILTIRHGYHGDTLGAMSVSDPENGMHQLFSKMLIQQFFADAPHCHFDEPCLDKDIASLRSQLEQHHHEIAAIILEPIVQGAGGMRIYSPDYLKQVRQLCDKNNVLLILDEIATGFGRTGKMFACEHAAIEPDIMCVGKALTGGYMSLAATITTQHIAKTINDGDPGVFMHGPTFMANPLACATAVSSLKLLLDSPWKKSITLIESMLKEGLKPCLESSAVKDVRILGAIGVIELYFPVDTQKIQPIFVERGVWIRPFNHLIYLMPPYVIEANELAFLIRTVNDVVSTL